MASELTQLVRAGVEEACVALSTHLAGAGFERSKKKLWIRVHEHTADVVDLFVSGSSYGAPINASVTLRLHFGIRVLNSPFPAVALNGAHSDRAPIDYHFRFNARTRDQFDRCVRDLGRFVDATGEPWFASFKDPGSLLERPDSPLRDDDKANLRAALAGAASAENLELSRRLLGIGKSRRPARR